MAFATTRRRAPGSLTASVLLVALAVSPFGPALASDKRYQEDDRFPGWKGELADVRTAAAAAEGVRERRDGAAKDWGYGSLGKESWRGEVQDDLWTPRVFSYRGFLSHAECDVLKELARDTDMAYPFELRDQDDSTVSLVNSRISEVTFSRRGSMQDLKLFSVAKGNGEEGPAVDDQLLATFFIKISAPKGSGGEVAFPAGKAPEGSAPEGGASECATGLPHVKLAVGDAVLVYHKHVDSAPDEAGKYIVCGGEGGESSLWAMQRIMTWPAKLGHQNSTPQ